MSAHPYTQENATARAREVLSGALRLAGHMPAWCAQSVECQWCHLTGAYHVHDDGARTLEKNGQIFRERCAVARCGR